MTADQITPGWYWAQRLGNRRPAAYWIKRVRSDSDVRDGRGRTGYVLCDAGRNGPARTMNLLVLRRLEN